jgi:hypothetical protein
MSASGLVGEPPASALKDSQRRRQVRRRQAKGQQRRQRLAPLGGSRIALAGDAAVPWHGSIAYSGSAGYDDVTQSGSQLLPLPESLDHCSAVQRDNLLALGAPVHEGREVLPGLNRLLPVFDHPGR